jgi:hypothetical protein
MNILISLYIIIGVSVGLLVYAITPILGIKYTKFERLIGSIIWGVFWFILVIGRVLYKVLF